jgi:pilus assembly protein CpaE
MRMGVAEFFEEAPDAERLRGVVQRIAAELVPENEAEKSARIVAVMGAKGGVGATVVACQIAARLQAGGARVAVVDLCLPLGDVALYFDVPCSYTIADIAQQKRQVDRTYLETLMDGKPGGVRILASPTRAEEAELVNGSHVEQVIGVLRRQFDWVILDVSRIFGEPTVRALDLADEILLVTLMDVSTLHHSHHLLELLERLGHTDERVRLVANRHAPDGPVEDKDVKEFLGRELDFRIPNDFPTAAATITQGASAADVAPRSALARAFAELHRNLHAWSDREPPAEKSRGAFARFVGRSCSADGERQSGVRRSERARVLAIPPAAIAQVGHGVAQRALAAERRRDQHLAATLEAVLDVVEHAVGARAGARAHPELGDRQPHIGVERRHLGMATLPFALEHREHLLLEVELDEVAEEQPALAVVAPAQALERGVHVAEVAEGAGELGLPLGEGLAAERCAGARRARAAHQRVGPTALGDAAEGE